MKGVQWLILVLIIGGIFGFWGYSHRGVERTAVIKSGSMEPVLMGPCVKCDCPFCRVSIKYSLNIDKTITITDENWRSLFSVANGRVITCPQCGYAQVPLNKGRFIPGDSVVIHSGAFEPKRFDIVAFRDEKGIGIVKRVMGLPGESITINNGDLFINGHSLSRTPSEIMSTAVPLRHVCQTVQKNHVFFVNLRPHTFETERKKPFYYELPVFSSSEIPGLTPPGKGTVYSQIEYVHDFILSLKIKRQSVFQYGFSIIVERGTDSILVRWTPENKIISLTRADNYSLKSPWNRELTDYLIPFYRSKTDISEEFVDSNIKVDPNVNINIFSCDGRIQVYWNNKCICSQLVAIKTLEADFQPVSIPFIYYGIKDDLLDVHIWRDIHYSKSNGLKTGIVPKDEYYLLGDNSPLSEDSRNWQIPTVSGKRLLIIIND